MTTRQQGPRKATQPLILIRPDIAGFWAVDVYDGRMRWQATEVGFNRETAKQRARELRRSQKDYR